MISPDAKDADSGDPALAALTKALEEIVRGDGQRSWRDEQAAKQQSVANRPVDQHADVAASGRRFAMGKSGLWSLFGLLVVACVGAVVFVWPSVDVRSTKSIPAVPEATLTSVSAASTRVETQAVEATKADNGFRQSQAQGVAQRAEPAAPVSPEITQWFQALERRLTNFEQEIEQIKASQSKLARENSELAARLMETQEKSARQAAELASDLKAAEEKATQDRLTAGEQLRISQDQLAKISEQLKANQEQLDRLSAGRQQRVVRVAPPQPQPPNAQSTPKPAPKPKLPSPQARVSPPPSSGPLQPGR